MTKIDTLKTNARKAQLRADIASATEANQIMTEHARAQESAIERAKDLRDAAVDKAKIAELRVELACVDPLSMADARASVAGSPHSSPAMA